MKKMLAVFAATFTLAFGAIGVYAAENPAKGHDAAQCATMQHDGDHGQHHDENTAMNHN
jgi:Spy/CpxP family protein refolding chaperone